MTSGQEEYERLLGQRLIAEAAAAQQQTQPPMDATMAQAQRNWTIAYDRNQAQLRREIEQAQAKQRQRDQERARQREQEQEERAQDQIAEWKAEALNRWTIRGLPLNDFDKQWPTILKEMQMEAYHGESPALAKVRQKVMNEMG